jgi:endonuclease YncB( thermonuclease family)
MRVAKPVPEDEPVRPARPFDVNEPPGSARQTTRAASESGTPVSAAPTEFVSGKATVAGSGSLMVGGRLVRLFGIRPPGSADRCAAEGPAATATAAERQPCTEVALAALKSRLRQTSEMNCRVPVPKRGGEISAVCLDSTGVDLGGYLIGEGLALADTSQSYDYVGAEGVAKSLRKGLWLYR